MRYNTYYIHRMSGGVAWQLLKLFVLFSLMTPVPPAWSASLMLPSVHQLKPIRRNPPPVLPGPRPVVTGASYHLAARCSNSLHAITVTVHIRNEGGPLKASLAKIVISELHRHQSPIWNANDGTGSIPALAPGQVYTTKLFVGTLPEYRKALPGAHTFFVEVSPNVSNNSSVSNNIPNSMYQFPVNIPAGYCQNRLTLFNKKSLHLSQRKPVYPPSPCLNGNCRTQNKSIKYGQRPSLHRQSQAFPPSPCITADCRVKNRIKLSQRSVPHPPYQLRPCHGKDCLTAKPVMNINKANAAKFGAALKPDLQVVSVKFNSEKALIGGSVIGYTVTSGKPIIVYAVVQNKGAIASKAGVVLHIYCSGYGNANNAPTGWTCKVPAQGTSPGGMPMWNIPLPAIPAHGQSDVALRIPEHWPEGDYYFTHSTPGQAVTIPYLQHAKDDGVVYVSK